VNLLLGLKSEFEVSFWLSWRRKVALHVP